ncbi:hypothetical protein Rsub_13102 [Raphidocelis subcapitata]|uniref:Uncharacterized protein n=1 Tax=Raphidocelis subcapitata TaxID=307507 RepID=A0A2V0PKK4_9CHLO|nr:hypothetical protein Rsub_13102 [Raphidocelis subcapitata]|eukprot:GBG00332.1 hypothetical protein Rsub_13102 [Raphidocelis subcapitata]
MRACPRRRAVLAASHELRGLYRPLPRISIERLAQLSRPSGSAAPFRAAACVALAARRREAQGKARAEARHAAEAAAALEAWRARQRQVWWGCGCGSVDWLSAGVGARY